MREAIVDMLKYLGMSFTEQKIDGILLIYTHRPYIHYDELNPFTKLGCFKGVSVDIKGNIVLQFV